MIIPALFYLSEHLSKRLTKFSTKFEESEKSDRRWNLLQYKLQEQRVVKTFELFRKSGIEPVLIKGWAAAQNYTQKDDRLFVDIDVCVAPEMFEAARKLVEECRQEGIMIDLHRGLRHLDTLEWEDLFKNSELVNLTETRVRVLRPEDHLRVLCVHWLNDGAANKDRLWDIYYAVENRGKNFDWDRCLNSVNKTRRKWIICAVGLARLHLGLNLKDTPIEAESEEIPLWILNTVEREWADEVKLKPLQTCLANRAEFFQQIKKRLPPNPIQATLDVGGEFDEKPRIFYQTADILIRFKPSLIRISRQIFQKNKSQNNA